MVQSNGLVTHTINLDYDYWTAGSYYYYYYIFPFPQVISVPLDEILQAILPEELREGSPTGFAATGHIGRLQHYVTRILWLICRNTAHLNLNDEYLPYKHLIGQLILDV
jgi:tRNA (guanine37-N1)-methyltransferase